MPLNDPVKLREGAVAWQQIDDEAVLLDLTTSEYLGVNEAGALLWPALAEGTTTERLVDALRQRFGIPSEQAEHDVHAFLAHCEQRGLLEPRA